MPTSSHHPNAPLIRIDHLHAKIRDTVVHDDLSLAVWPGEILSIVGGSGSGKTTLLRQILGLSQPSGGTIQVFGHDVHHAEPAVLQAMRQRWGVLFQQGALFSALNVFDNIALPMRELGVLPRNVVRDAVLLKLDLVGLTPDDALKMPAELSGGMIKRVALARALALDPELLFLDEPTAGLDPQMGRNFVDLIRTLQTSLRLTVVMVTHDLDTLLDLSSKIAVLAERKLIAYGTPEEVMRVPHPFIHSYFQTERS